MQEKKVAIKATIFKQRFAIISKHKWNFEQIILQNKKRVSLLILFLSGWQDSNLRPPAPKAGAITELRYTPKAIANIVYYF